MNIESTIYCIAAEIRTTTYLLSEKKLLVICPFNKGEI
jgi:hypothetical protein